MGKNQILLKGTPASSGKTQGVVKVVRKLSELHKVKNGDIIVVSESSPAWTVGMMRAAGLVSEHGGIICHAAIIAREMGIPCVVNINSITTILKDNMKAEINGTDGTIKIL